MVLPGAPGDEPEVTTGSELGQQPQSGSPEAEVDYVGMMIPHHRQAIEMTGLAADRAEHPKVRALAERIGGAQGPEIGAMEGWLASRGHGHANGHGQEHGQPPAHGADHAMMPGMATPEQMAELGAARGADFDRLFLRLMTAHHEGAVRMATDYLTRGTDEQVHEMAQDVLATQTDEIATMRGLSAELA